jgi:hypothetical protein
MLPRGYLEIARTSPDDPGLLSYRTAHCGNGNPTTGPELPRQLKEKLPFLQNPPPPGPPGSPPPPTPESLARNILQYVFIDRGRDIPRPPCVQQPPYSVRDGAIVPGGEISRYPHVREASSSASAPRG